MFVKRFFEPSIAQASYLIGCAAAGEAIVIDANRDVAAVHRRRRGRRACASRTSPKRTFMPTSCPARASWRRGRAPRCVSPTKATRTGSINSATIESSRTAIGITIGNVAIDVAHTPGHTPEHLTFLITDGAAADRPIAAVTGDFLFVGDVGRPDLLERAANITGTMERSARTLWQSLQQFAAAAMTGCRSGRGTARALHAVRASAPSPQSTLGYETPLQLGVSAIIAKISSSSASSRDNRNRRPISRP